MTKYSYAIFFVENAEVTRGTFYSRPTDSLQRAASTFVALLTANESLRGARIPVRDLGARLRRPPWVRSFCRRASSRACGSRYAPPPGVRRARPPRQPARIRFRFRHPPLTEPRPVHAQLRDATITPETRDDDRAHLKALSDARAARWPNTLEVRDRPAALVATDPPIPFWTRRDETSKRALVKKKKESRRLDERNGRTALTFPPPNRPERPRLSFSFSSPGHDRRRRMSNRLAARTKKPLARRSPPRRSRRAAPPIALRLRLAPRRVSAKSRAPTRCCTTRRNA